MGRSIRAFAFAAVLAVPAIAPAQPVVPPPGGADAAQRGNGPPGAIAPAAAPGPAPTAAIDEARIRELVDRELARVLTERAAREAAERAAKETATRDAAVSDAVEVRGASGFTDTRLAFTLSNENLFAKPGETTPSVPGWRFGAPSSLGVLFFDHYDTRYSGFENLSHAVLYREYSHGHLQAEAGLVLRINELSAEDINLADDGSYLTLSYWRDPSHKDPARISLTAFPISADRLRLGYSYRLSWGGSPEYNHSGAGVPGIKLQVDSARGYAFIAAKTALVPDRENPDLRAALGVLGGAGIEFGSMLRLEINGGTFDRGDTPFPGVRPEKLRLLGASFQASLHHGMPVSSSLDYQLYRFHGESVSGWFAPERYPGGVAWLAQSEVTVLGQRLRDPATPTGTVIQRAIAEDLNLRVKLDRIRLRLDLSYRSVPFILHTDLVDVAYSDFPLSDATSGDYFAAAGIDRNWNDWLTLGLIAGVEKPATLTIAAVLPGPPGSDGTVVRSTEVIRSDNVETLRTPLPIGRDTAPVEPAVKLSARADLSSIFAILVEVSYRYSRSQSRASPCADPLGCAVDDAPEKRHQLGVQATLQAHF